MFSTNLGLLLTEIGVYGAAIALAILFPRVRLTWLDGLKTRYVAFARRRWAAILLVMALVLVLRGALLPLLPPPVPGVHDEFSYILAGDTFASGRLANPAHPLWKSLETFYVIQKPTYASMYPPAQGVALAVGDLLGRNPWIGVYLSVALMCGAVCWMLQAWVPPEWALMGGIIVALRLGVYSYWMESYWGGAVAALGGALAAGALPRLIRGRKIWPALILGIGLLILANSRPFEGLLFALPLLGWLWMRLAASKAGLRLVPARTVAAFALVLLAGGSTMGYYFWRTTGSPLRMPYQLHSTTYEVTGPFIWQPLRKTPSFRYVVMEKYHVERQTAAYREAHSVNGWLAETWRKAESIAVFYFWPGILPVALALPFLRRDSRTRFVLIASVIMFAGLTLEIWPMTLHYHAPLTALTVLLLVQVMRFWRQVTWRGRRIGTVIAMTIPLFCAGMLGLRLGAAVLHVRVPEHGLAPWFTVAPGNLARASVARYLEKQPGLQLAIVRYSGTHHVDEEWVHNAADIDGSKVVWAREGAAAQNAALLQYFQQRRVWLVEADEKPPRVIPWGVTLASRH